MIRLSWVKYIWASIGLCSVWVGVSDGRLDLLVLGLILTPILWLSGYGFERFLLSRKRVDPAQGLHNLTSGGEPITPMKRRVSGIAVIAFGAFVAPFGNSVAGVFIVMVGILILKAPVLKRMAERKP